MSTRTLTLDPDKWDLVLDSRGDIADSTGDYATAQDVANAIRLFTDEAYFDMQRGVPHYEIDLALRPSLSQVRARYRKAALGVTNVADASVSIYEITDERVMRGEVFLTTETGTRAEVSI